MCEATSTLTQGAPTGGGAAGEVKISPIGENRMNKVTSAISMSLDAFVAGHNQSFENPFGDIPEDFLHHWMFDEPEKHQAELNALTDAGAFIMGSNMFGPKQKRESRDWKGWPQWGDNPPIMHRCLCCLGSTETQLRWRVVPPTSSWHTALKQRSLPQKKWLGREMLLSWAAPIRSINT